MGAAQPARRLTGHDADPAQRLPKKDALRLGRRSAARRGTRHRHAATLSLRPVLPLPPDQPDQGQAGGIWIKAEKASFHLNPFALSKVEVRAKSAAVFGTHFDCAQDERRQGTLPSPFVSSEVETPALRACPSTTLGTNGSIRAKRPPSRVADRHQARSASPSLPKPCRSACSSSASPAALSAQP